MSKTFVLAPDSFKESMTANEACQAMRLGIARIFPDANIISVPMADGGEGTVDAILAACAGEKVKCEVMGPLAEQCVEAYFALLDQGQTAVVEMALANGIQLLDVSRRNPLYTSSYGTGQLISAALDQGVKRIIIGLGGSVTNDAGIGMAQALGARFYDIKGRELNLGAECLLQLDRIDITGLDPRLAQTDIVIASDVTNPLLGPNGASYIYGPQKGATAAQVPFLDQSLAHVAARVQSQLGIDVQDIAGSGAAGGLGYGLMVFASAKMSSGVETMLDLVQLKQYLPQADYVFTGEGAIDQQTLQGKTPFGVMRIAQQFNVPVIACAGRVGEGIDALYTAGFSAIFSIVPECCTVEQACLHGAENLERCCENIARIMRMAES